MQHSTMGVSFSKLESPNGMLMTLEARRVGSSSPETVDGLLHALQKLRWMDLEAEAQAIERLFSPAAPSGPARDWPGDTVLALLKTLQSLSQNGFEDQAIAVERLFIFSRRDRTAFHPPWLT